MNIELFELLEERKNEKGLLSRSIRVILMPAAILVGLSNLLLCIVTIPYSTVISSPEFLSGYKVIYVLILTILIVLPVISLLFSLILSLLPLKKMRHRNRILPFFLIILIIPESIGLLQLTADSFNY